MAVVVLVIGLVAAISMGAFSNAFGSRSTLGAAATGDQIVGAVLAYAQNQHRLPCPDADGDAREDGVGSACPGALEIGFVPYESLGLQRPATVARAIYGVYRNPTIAADLVAPSAGPARRQDLQRALQAAAQVSTVTADHVYVTGEGAATGAIDCAGNRVLHPAFVIVVPAADRDGDGTPFDGVNASLPATGTCIASPNQQPDAVFDDHVALIGFSTLLGLISRNAP